MKEGGALAQEVKYVPLPQSVYTANLKHIAENKRGTIFGGKNEVGISIEELIKREAKL
jgi:phosphate transport system substrate-binding protein